MAAPRTKTAGAVSVKVLGAEVVDPGARQRASASMTWAAGGEQDPDGAGVLTRWMGTSSPTFTSIAV